MCLIGSGLRWFQRSRPLRRTITSSASSSTLRCCITVQRSSAGKAAHSSPVICGRSLSASRIARRTGAARALKTLSESSSLDMLYFYNMIRSPTRRPIMELRFSVSGRIARPVAEVFEAVVDPAQLSRYFTTGGARGRLETGATVHWDFHDFPGAFPVEVVEVEKDRRIVLRWEAEAGTAATGTST